MVRAENKQENNKNFVVFFLLWTGKDWLANCLPSTNRWQIIKLLRAHKRKQKCDMKASETANPGARSPLHHRYVSWDIIQALSTRTKTEYLSHLQFEVAPQAREEESQRRGIAWLQRREYIPPLFPLLSCVRMTQLSFFFPPFFLSFLFSFTPALLELYLRRLFLSPCQPSGLTIWFTDTTAPSETSEESLSCKVHRK